MEENKSRGMKIRKVKKGGRGQVYRSNNSRDENKEIKRKRLENERRARIKRNMAENRDRGAKIKRRGGGAGIQ